MAESVLHTYDLHSKAKALSIEEWIKLVAESAEKPVQLGERRLSTFPSASLQESFVGVSGSKGMLGASQFYRHVMQMIEAHGTPGTQCMLDFGTGWGRFARFFVRDFPDDALFGVDPMPAAIGTCREHIPYATFMLTNPFPPLPFRDGFFSTIAGFSVFSHLSELFAQQWIIELARVLRPGGLLIATTQARWFIDECEEFANGTTPRTHFWHEGLAKSWLGKTPNEARAAYDRGEFIYASTGGSLDPSGQLYGEALVPEEYARTIWGRTLELVDFTMDRGKKLGQACFVLRKQT
jgi:SAM-dependent methyltransferase